MNIKKALVVDDSKVAHLTLRKLLLERSVEVDWVGSGEDCIKYLDNKKPDIIFMDVMMPGMDGFETSRAITGQNLQDSPPIIMCSANATDEDKRDAKESGAIGFLSKPYTPEQLDAILRAVSEGTSAISMDAAAAHPAVPLPTVVEKPVAAPPPPVAPPAVPPAEISTAPTPVAVTERTSSDIEQIAERVAWAAAEKVARDIIQETVPNMTREIAMQTARGISEDLGRRAAHAAVRAAQEAAKQVATEIARGTAERTARSAAQESARTVAEQAVREASESVSQRHVGQTFELNREELLKELEGRIEQQTKANLATLTATPEFKQQILQSVRSGIQPMIETVARETAERSLPSAGVETDGALAKRASLALALGAIALLVSAAALLGYLFKLF